MAPTEKNEQSLARHYGLDISMPDVNFAVASAAQKDYQKKCSYLYKEFTKNMNAYIKQEQNIKKDLRKLKQEKILNSQYSLYRSDGKDLFSTAKQKRHMFMENNMQDIPASFFDDFCFTPWGLDSIIDEDLIPAETAPAEDNKVVTSPRQGRRSSVAVEGSVVNEESHPIKNTVTHEDIRLITKDGATNEEKRPVRRCSVALSEAEINACKTLAARLDSRQIDTQLAKVEHLLTTQSEMTERPNTTKPKLVIPDDEPTVEDVDGEVDVQTERTRARNIVINPTKFFELQRGNVNVKLKNKDGAFLIKPVKMNYTPTGADAVFIAKDPTKERMALVRQNTDWKSPTVAAELKVNNRIAIQKSLIGKAAKKTTVAEIFNSARDRKTRHFKIISKAQKSDESGEEPAKSPTDAPRPRSSPLIKISNPSTAGNRPKSDVIKTQPKKIREAFVQQAPPKMKIFSRENSLSSVVPPSPHHDSSHLSAPWNASNTNVNPSNKRSFESTSSYIRPPSQSSVGSHEVFSTSGHHRVTFGKDMPDRSASSLSLREGGVQFAMSDADMTSMIQRLVEGKGEDGDYNSETSMDISNAMKAVTFIKRLSRMSNSRKRNTPTSDVASSTGQRKVSSRNDTKSIIRDEKKKDSEYDDMMSSMRRRVALGASRKMGGSRLGHR